MWAHISGLQWMSANQNAEIVRFVVVRGCPYYGLYRPFHSGDTGSTPVGVANNFNALAASWRLFLYLYGIYTENVGRNSTGNRFERLARWVAKFPVLNR